MKSASKILHSPALATALLALLLLQTSALADMILIEENVGAAGTLLLLIEENVGAAGILLESEDLTGVEIHYAMDRFSIEPLTINNEVMHTIALPGAMLPNDAGAPNLPGLSRIIALPQGAHATFTIASAQTRIYGGFDVAPAAPIPLETDDAPPQYEKDPSIYDTDVNYPASPVMVSKPWKVRGVDVVTVGITPFQYNPVTRELTVYTQLDIRIDFGSGNGQFGEDRLRNRYWEPLLRDHLMNYNSLPEINFNVPPEDRDGYEYVIICPDDPEFIACSDTLKTWRKLQGISTAVFTTTDIGGTSTTIIENFLNDAYNTWEVPPVAFLIVGDYPSSGDGGGSRAPGIYSPMWNNFCVSDNIYADVDGDNLPEMAHGRICPQLHEDLEIMIGKMLSYEREPYTDPYFYDHPVIAGAWQTDRWYILCCEIILGHQVNVLGKDPIREYGIWYGDPDSVWSTNQNTYMVVDYFGPSGLGYIPSTPEHLQDWGGNATRINNDINAGAYFAFHRDHGNLQAWSMPDYGIEHLNQLTNDMFPFVLSINCQSGQYNAAEESFTERFHRIEHGALGVIAASAGSHSFVNDTFVWGMFDSMWPDFDPGYGAADDSIGSSRLRTAFAHTFGKYYLEASNWPSNQECKIHTYHLYHHHGDAFIQMYSEVPEQLTVIHDGFCPLNEEAFAIQANAGSVIGLTVDGEIIGVADATGAMQNVPIAPQTEEGSLRITVTKANYFRYDVTIPIEWGPIFVMPDGTGDYPTIQAAIDVASDGDLIELDDGIFVGEGNRDLDYQGKELTIQALSGNAVDCIIDPEGTPLDPHRGFYFHCGESSASILKNVTIRNGWASPAGPPDVGGGILCSGSSPQIIGCIFSDNTAVEGGGLFCEASSPTLSSCSFEGNLATSGAVSAGGALACNGSSPNVTYCQFVENSADSIGGAIHCLDSSPRFKGIVFAGNSASLGGAISLQNSSPGFNQCTLYGNDAPWGGAGFCLDTSSSPIIENVIISFGTHSEAVCCSGGTAASLSCCDIYGNAGGDWVGCIEDQEGVSGNFSLDPCFCDAPSGDFQLWNYSPCQQVVCGQIGAQSIGCWDPQGARETGVLPLLELDRNHPNPFTQMTSIAYLVPRSADGAQTVLEVFDPSGRLVRTLVNRPQAAGSHAVSWDGCDQRGERVSSGVYYYQLRINGERTTKRMVLLH